MGLFIREMILFRHHALNANRVAHRRGYVRDRSHGRSHDSDPRLRGRRTQLRQGQAFILAQGRDNNV